MKTGTQTGLIALGVIVVVILDNAGLGWLVPLLFLIGFPIVLIFLGIAGKLPGKENSKKRRRAVFCEFEGDDWLASGGLRGGGFVSGGFAGGGGGFGGGFGGGGGGGFGGGGVSGGW